VPGQVLARYLEQRSDRVEAALIHAALEETWSWLTSEVSSNPTKWTWGQAHRLRLSHAFERLGGGLTRLIGRRLGRGPFEAPGDPGSIWAMFSEGTEPFRPRVGPAFRFAIDLADPAHARFGLSGGQSGLPGSAAYADAIDDWLQGRPRVLWMHPADLAYHAQGTWELRPGPP
jgi:penicillin amidase